MGQGEEKDEGRKKAQSDIISIDHTFTILPSTSRVIELQSGHRVPLLSLCFSVVLDHL